jgi:hypothetical protein
MNIPANIAHVYKSSARSDAAYAQAVDTSSVACEGESPREWRPAPGELVSLWDMLRINAHAFVRLMTGMAKSEADLVHRQERVAQLFAALGTKSQELALSAMQADAPGKMADFVKQVHWELDELREVWSKGLEEAKEACQLLQLQSALAHIPRMLRVFEGLCPNRLPDLPRILADQRSAVKEFGDRVVDELVGRVFMFIPPERAKHFLEERPFGNVVHAKYPTITEDIVEAAKCLGAGRYTASVFHLLRVMEFGVGRLAKILSRTIKLDGRTWGQILKDVDAAIALLPGATLSAPEKDRDRHAHFAEVAAYLHQVKDAWRNRTMHPKKTYTGEEADLLFRNVRKFTQSLVKLR